MVKSKIIKKGKNKEEYTDDIIKENTGIFVIESGVDRIITISNIPPKTKVVFISEFLQNTLHKNKKFEYELFRYLPIIKETKNQIIYNNDTIKGYLLINTENEIIDIEKKLKTKI